MSIHQFACGAIAPPQALAILPPAFWRFRYNLVSDLSVFGGNVSANSYRHYQLGLSVGGNTRMGRATGDTACLDRALFYVLGIMNLATTQAGGFLGWKSVEDGNRESALREIYCWRSCTELADLCFATGGSYVALGQQIKDFLEVNIWDKWTSRGLSSYVYWSVVHICAHWAKIALWLTTNGSTPARRALATTVLDTIDHLGMPNWGGASFRNALYPGPNGGSIWNAYHDDRDAATGSDTSHAQALYTFVADARRAGYQWTQTDVENLILGFRNAWPLNGNHWEYLKGAVVGTQWAGKYTEFFCLGEFSRQLQRDAEADEVRGIADGAEKWGILASNAARLGGPYL